jgi:WD40 repeat protein
MCMQSKSYSRGRKLVACLFDDNRAVIHDLDSGNQKVIEINMPWKCASSQNSFAITTVKDGLRLFSIDGDLIHIVPDSIKARNVAFHPRSTNILAIGYEDGTVRLWDVSMQAYISSFKQHSGLISNIRFVPDCRLFLSSRDTTASIISLDDHFQMLSSVKLEGHTDWVRYILHLLSSNQCVTCSADETMKVWDCETGECLRTLTEHTDYVACLALHTTGQYFASGSDRVVILWSSETFEILRRFTFPSWVQSLAFENNTLYVGVDDHGVMSCNTHTDEVGTVIIPGTGICESLSLGKSSQSTSHHAPTLITPQYLHPSPGLHPHMPSGSCLHNTLCTWLWWCCGRCAFKDD